MRLIGCARRLLGPVAWLAACGAIVALAQDRFVPARYRDGAPPQLPIRALGGGEVWLELTVSSVGAVSSVRVLRATPPFTEALAQAVRPWRFAPAEDAVDPAPGRADEPARRRPVDSKVLVAGLFRPPTLNTPTLGETPRDLASASDEIPVPLATVMPGYPPLARDSGIALVEVEVDSRGDVVDARAIRPSPPFDGPAVEAARQWKFRPARLHGSPVDMLAYIAFGFRQPVTIVPQRGAE